MKQFKRMLSMLAILMLQIASINLFAAAAPAPDLVWTLKPTLAYDRIMFCGVCDVFFIGDGEVIDRQTGQPTGQNHGGHGGDGTMLFDSEQNLIGISALGPYASMYSIDHFEEVFAGAIGRLIAVEHVYNSRHIEQTDETGGNGSWEVERSGMFAVMYNGAIITEFRFTDYNRAGDSANDAIAMRRDNAWGSIGPQGNDVIPFRFGHVVHIDDHFVFVQYHGYYGILDIRRTLGTYVPESEPPTEPATTTEPESDNDSFFSFNFNFDFEFELHDILLIMIAGLLLVILLLLIWIVVLKRRRN